MSHIITKKLKFIDLRNLSKNEITKKVNHIKSAKTNLNRKNIIKINNEKINLFTPQKFALSSNFCGCEKKLKNSSGKIKRNLLIESDYSSFISKNSKIIKSENPLADLLSPNLIKAEIKYRKLFSAKSNFSQNRTKSSTTKNTNSNFINYESSFKNSDIKLLSSKPSKSNIFYSKKLHNSLLKNSFSQYRRENVSDFMEKSRIIRRSKIIKIDIENKLFSENEMKKENANFFDSYKEGHTKSFSLFGKFMENYNNYVKNIKLEKIKENQLNDDLIRKIFFLKMKNENLQKQINKLLVKKTKYNNMKNFFLTVKYGEEFLKNKDKIDYSLTFSQNIENKKNSDKKLISKSINPKLSNNENKENNKKRKIERYYSINKFKTNSRNIINSNNINRKGKEKHNTYKKTKSDIDDRFSLDEEYQFIHTFTNIENNLLNNLNYLNSQKRNINEIKKKLKEIENDKNDKDIYKDILESKNKMLEFLKSENIKLKTKLKIMKKESLNKENFKNKLEKKLLYILKNINSSKYII